MSEKPTPAILKTVLLGLVAGGLCGAAIGFGFVPAFVGVVGAVAVGLYVGIVAYRLKRRDGGTGA